MIQVNLNYKRLQGFPWFAQITRKLEYRLGRGPVIFIACLGGGGESEDFKGNDMVSRGNGGGISCRQQSLKRRTFENLTAIEWLGGGGGRGGRRIDSTPPPPPPISHPTLSISCMTFLLSVLCDKTYYK